jgi:hypothetical protein
MSKTTLTASNVETIVIREEGCIYALRIMGISTDGPMAIQIDNISKIQVGKIFNGGWWVIAFGRNVDLKLPNITDTEVIMALATIAAAQK